MRGRRRRKPTSYVWRCAMLGLLSGCASALNYADPAAPRYAATAVQPATRDDADLRVVSFNIQYAQHIDRAVRVLLTEDSLRNADIVLLQEMDAAGTAAIAEALGRTRRSCGPSTPSCSRGIWPRDR